VRSGPNSRSAYESRPALAIEALDTLARIDLAAARWVRDLGEDDPSSTVACVSLLGGLVASANRCHAPRAIVDRQTRKVLCCTWHAIEQDVRTWWTQARITTGWEALAWRPDNTCPLCGERRTLRIRLEERIGLCTNCHETWTPTGEPGYQTLANHIRAEADERGSRRTAVGPCWCPWPLSSAQEAWRGRLFGICPRCGSASCRHAVRSKPKRSA
jgi:hypothetical protein